jgi:hypothetical protein
MKFKNYKILYSIVFFIIVVILSIPSLNINILGQDINIQNVNLGYIIPGSTIGDTQKGAFTFAGNEFVFRVSSEENLTDTSKLRSDISKIRTRLDLGGLKDVKIQGESNENGQFIRISAPQYYQNFSTIAKWIVTKGEIIFFASNNSGGTFSLELSDLAGPFSISNSSEVLQSSNEEGKTISFPMGMHLVNFLSGSNEKTLKYQDYKAFMLDSTSSIAMIIDGTEILYLIPERNVSTNEVTPRLRFVAVSSDLTTPEIKTIFYSLAQTYTLDTLLDLNYEYIEDGKSLVADITTLQPRVIDSLSNFVLIILGIVVVQLVYILSKFGRISAIKFGLYQTLSFCTLIVLLKLFSTPISLGVLIGSFLFVIISSIINYGLIKITKIEDFKEKIYQNNKVIKFLIITLVLVTYVFVPFIIIHELFITFAVGLIGLWFLNNYNYRFIFEILDKNK